MSSYPQRLSKLNRLVFARVDVIQRPLEASPLIVTKLILSLYEPASPSTIAKTQSTLSRLQSSPQAWTLAHHLLGRPDDKVKFFGALTIIVKLNTEKYVLLSAWMCAEL